MYQFSIGKCPFCYISTLSMRSVTHPIVCCVCVFYDAFYVCGTSVFHSKKKTKTFSFVLSILFDCPLCHLAGEFCGENMNINFFLVFIVQPAAEVTGSDYLLCTHRTINIVLHVLRIRALCSQYKYAVCRRKWIFSDRSSVGVCVYCA